MENKENPLMSAYLIETGQFLSKLERVILECEKEQKLNREAIDEIFRVMHSIKGSSAMMGFVDLAELAHIVEDMFFFIRESNPTLNFREITDVVLESVDYFKDQIDKIELSSIPDGESSILREKIKDYLQKLKFGDQEIQKNESSKKAKMSISLDDDIDGEFSVWIKFDDGCLMESVRAFAIQQQLMKIGQIIKMHPEDLSESSNASELIAKEGFSLYILTHMNVNDIKQMITENNICIQEINVVALEKEKIMKEQNNMKLQGCSPEVEKIMRKSKRDEKQSVISVNITKLDKLMDIVGELVISEAMVIRNPEITGLKLKSFTKASTQLKKITAELQEIVMSIRMIPIGPTFISMQRILRDMCKKLDKDADLHIVGENTEVDKSVIDNITDPLIHLIRNSIDHGIEESVEREKVGKPARGKVTLEARQEGGDVWIIIKDDGRGLDREAILKKAKGNGLFEKKEEELTDKEIWSFILMPGFSTKENVSEFSGRGVGMDIVKKNIEKLGGRIEIDSIPGKGTTIITKIPLTLAVVNGMELAVGDGRYTISTTAIKEAFRPKGHQIITDHNGNELIMLRGQCFEIIRLHRSFNIETSVKNLEEGILIVAESEERTVCIFADKLIGEHQVVVKPVPQYMGRIDGISGCTILGDGSISLIIDVPGLIGRNEQKENGRVSNE